MALIPKTNQCFTHNCSKLVVNDTTGEYSSSNTGGWESPNIGLSDVAEALLIITLPSGTEHEFDVTDTVTGASIVNGFFQLAELTPEDFGLDCFSDGYYKFRYVITDEEGIEYVYCVEIYSTCKAFCCVQKMLLKWPKYLANCQTDKIMEYFKAEALLFSIQSAFASNDRTTADKHLLSLQKICKSCGCCC